MPLRAIIDGQDIIAPFLSQDEWEDLRSSIKSHQKELRMPCCQNTGHLRTSNLGTNHFVHNRRGGCDWKPETLEHLKGKTEIALACREAGYEVATEASGTCWRADVLASKGSVKIAFEIQWSRQTLEETQRRQEQYQKDGIRGCWFFKTPPNDLHEATRELPLFWLQLFEGENGHSFRVKTQSESAYYGSQVMLPLDTFVKSLLNRRIKFCSRLKAKRNQSLRIVFMEMECWRCKKMSHVYYVSNQIASHCGARMGEIESLWDSEKLEFNKAVLNEVMQFINSTRGSHLKLGRIKPRYSRTVNKSYQSFGCYHCDVIFGDWFISKETLHAMYYEDSAPAVLEVDITLPDPLPVQSSDHWCFSEEMDFCE